MRKTESIVLKSATYIVTFIIIGLGAGWFSGLSASPVASLIVSSLLSVVAVLNAARESTVIRPAAPFALALALIAIGLITGSMVGLTARTHDWFGINVLTEVEKWEQLGLDQAEVARALFSYRYGESTQNVGEQEETSEPRSSLGILFNITSDECDRLMAVRNNELSEEMRISGNDVILAMTAETQDPAVLRAGIEELCLSN